MTVKTDTQENTPRIMLETGGFEALVLQHELDHLQGHLFLDRVANIKTDIFLTEIFIDQEPYAQIIVTAGTFFGWASGCFHSGKKSAMKAYRLKKIAGTISVQVYLECKVSIYFDIWTCFIIKRTCESSYVH